MVAGLGVLVLNLIVAGVGASLQADVLSSDRSGHQIRQSSQSQTGSRRLHSQHFLWSGTAKQEGQARVPYLFDVDAEPTVHEACSHCEIYQWWKHGNAPQLANNLPKGLNPTPYLNWGDGCCGVCQNSGRFCRPGAGVQLAGPYARLLGYDFWAFHPKELFARIRGKTLWFWGDSQIQGLYYATECFLREFAIGFRSKQYVRTHNLTSDATAQARLHGLTYAYNEQPFCLQLQQDTRVCFVKLVAIGDCNSSGEFLTPGVDIIKALLETRSGNLSQDVAVLNVGLWYSTWASQQHDSDALVQLIRAERARLPHIVWMALPRQHFATAWGYFEPLSRACMPSHDWFKGAYGRDAYLGSLADQMWQAKLRGAELDAASLGKVRKAAILLPLKGALGCGSASDNYEPEPVALQATAMAIGAGHHHSFAITAGGELWSWGRSREGQLGRSDAKVRSEVAETPGLVAALAGIQVTSATGSGVASFATCTEGGLWAWGSSRRGQLGLGPDISSSRQPARVDLPEPVVQMACGWGHAVALTGGGAVYSWGYPQHGRLGRSFAAIARQDQDEEAVMRRCIWQPQRVDLLSGFRITQVACGLDHTLAVADTGELFAFGDNSLGQLGCGSPEGDAPLGAGGKLAGRDACVRRAELEAPERWLVRDEGGRPLQALRVAAGLGHSLVVTAEGRVLAWGWNGAGQLGLGVKAKEEVVAAPQPVYGLAENPDALLAAGRVHSVVASDDVLEGDEDQEHAGTLTQCYSWGSGQNGRLALGTQLSAPTPELIPDLDGEDIAAVACGHDHTLVLLRQ